MTVDKIPTLFERDPRDTNLITRNVHPACHWVTSGHGTATRKYDGTCVAWFPTVKGVPIFGVLDVLDFGGAGPEDLAGRWYARREVRPGKTAPEGYVAVGQDPVTGKIYGWEPAEQSSAGWWPLLQEADAAREVAGLGRYFGTYELCGPKINRNPEDYEGHTLVFHHDAEVLRDVPRTYDELMAWLIAHPEYEGVVWHHADGRKAKIKRRDAVTMAGL